MRYYKIVEDGYIVGIGTGDGGEEISSEEYRELLLHIKSCPAAGEGFVYRLREDLEWELFALISDADRKNTEEKV